MVEIDKVYEAIEKFVDEYNKKRKKNYKIDEWIDQVAKNAEKITYCTHVAKLTHSSSKASNISDNEKQTKYNYLLTTQTSNITDITDFDMFSGNANLFPYLKFLNYSVENSNKKLGQLLAEDEVYFSKIINDADKRKYWQEKIKEVYLPKITSSDILAKQIYIPVKDKDKYHVLCPVKSSSLAHKIFNKINKSRDKKDTINEARKKRIFNEGEYISFGNLAFLKVTNSNPANVSLLNSKRGSKLYLFKSSPPLWKNNPNPPASIKQFLDNHCYENIKNILAKIKNLLYVIKEKDLTIKFELEKILEEHITDISDTIMDQIIFIKQNRISGWSTEFKMKDNLRLFLDPSYQLSKEEKKDCINEFIEHIAQWICKKVDDKYETKKFKEIYLKNLKPLFEDFYAVITVE